MDSSWALLIDSGWLGDILPFISMIPHAPYYLNPVPQSSTDCTNSVKNTLADAFVSLLKHL